MDAGLLPSIFLPLPLGALECGAHRLPHREQQFAVPAWVEGLGLSPLARVEPHRQPAVLFGFPRVAWEQVGVQRAIGVAVDTVVDPLGARHFE